MIGLKYYLKNLWKGKYYIPIYNPRTLQAPARLLQLQNKTSGWQGIELIIQDILKRFEINCESCIEFGVEQGFSTVALSSFFKRVVGIDTFEGDMHAGEHADHFAETKLKLSVFENIELFKSNYKDWTSSDKTQYDFAHVDIIHTYEDTYACGLWAAQHATCTIFHDTESFMTVRKAVIDIAKSADKRLYNYPLCHGLAIMTGKRKF